MFQFVIDHEQLLARTQLVLFMTGMGATLLVADFIRIFRQPKYLALGLAGQVVLAGLIAWVIILIGDFDAGIATGLLLVAASPGGNLSKVFTYIARGNIALSISMSAATTVLCLATIPLALELLTANEILHAVDIPPDANMLIIIELVLFLLAPLAAGMVLVRFLPQWHDFLAKWLIRAGLAIAVIMVVGSVGAGRVRGDQHGLAVLVAIIIFCVLSQQLSMLSFRLLRWSNPDCVSVGIETTMRNINLSFALVALLFPVNPAAIDHGTTGGQVLFVMLVYAATAFFAAIPLALRMRRVIRREQARASLVPAAKISCNGGFNSVS